MTLRDALELWSAWLAPRRARNTCLLYRSRTASLAAELGERELAAIAREDLEAWLVHAGTRADGTLKAADTRRANAIALAQFQAWCVEHGHLQRPIVERLPKPAGRQRERIPTAEETERLLSHATRAFRLVYNALRQCGARPSELCRAQICDYHKNAIILAEHKTAHSTGRSRRIAVGRKLAAFLAEAIGQRTEGPIFLTETNRPWRAQRLSTVYRQLRDAAGLPKDLVLYLARHEHGTKITQKLGIHVAKEALGHTSIKTTQRYAHSTDDERAANQDAFEP